MSNLPYSQEFITQYNSLVSPSTVHIKNTGLAQFFKRYLLEEAISRYKFTLPENWNYTYFTSVLFIIGYIFGFDKEPKFGLIPQHGFLGGRNVQYQPYYCMISNPLFERGSYRLIVNEECSLIQLQPDYCGLYDIVDFYGDLMALCAETVGVNILNSKLSFVFASKNKAMSESFKKLYDQYASGEPAVFADSKLFDDEGNLLYSFVSQNVGQNFIADRLLDCLGVIRDKFLTDIGIPNANTDKRERLNTQEVNSNNIETGCKAWLWLQTMKDGFKKTREMFGLSESELNVEWSDIPNLNANGGDKHGDIVNTGAV